MLGSLALLMLAGKGLPFWKACALAKLHALHHGCWLGLGGAMGPATVVQVAVVPALAGAVAGGVVATYVADRSEPEHAAQDPGPTEPADVAEPQNAHTGEPRIEVVVADRLEDIKGIGPVYAARLNRAGIYRFSDLLTRSPKELLAAVVVDGERFRPNVDTWVEQARVRVGKGGDEPS